MPERLVAQLVFSFSGGRLKQYDEACLFGGHGHKPSLKETVVHHHLCTALPCVVSLNAGKCSDPLASMMRKRDLEA